LYQLEDYFVYVELLAKKRKRDEQWAAEKAASAVEAKKKARTTRSAIFKKAEQYVKEYRSKVLATYTPDSGVNASKQLKSCHLFTQ
jgi:hypothetical protein